MGTYDIIKMLCEKRGTNITSLEQALGFGRGSIGKLRTAHKAMNTDRAKKIADYFGVSVEYILTGEMSDGYYINNETARIAQLLYERHDLSLLFEAAEDAPPEDVELAYQMLKALKAKEQKS